MYLGGIRGELSESLAVPASGANVGAIGDLLAWYCVPQIDSLDGGPA